MMRSYVWVVLLANLLVGCRGAESPSALAASPSRGPGLSARMGAALEAAARYLVSKQSPDGAWRSTVYGPLRDGPSLTPHVLVSLSGHAEGGSAGEAAVLKGAAYLERLRREVGRSAPGGAALSFPVYTAALAQAASLPGEQNAETWRAYLRARQLDEDMGWRPSDAHYGGWGYAVGLPRKAAPGALLRPPVESNLSATVYALDALSGSTGTEKVILNKALVFVKRCQNFAENAREADARFDDGGFFFRPGDAAKNKAGAAGKDRRGRVRFSSYGGMTADGLRALLACGLPESHPRVVAARKWMERHFTTRTNPGNFARDREVIRDATYYYYCRSVARTFRRLQVRSLDTRTGRVEWPTALAEELLRRQRPDGSWVNRYTDTKEDDPLVATPLAMDALMTCRRAMDGA